MSTEEARAQLLADWLSQPPGTDPPAGLEPEVVAAVYAVRPDLAPSPRTRIGDVLGRVTTGPFAEAQGDGGEVVSLSAARARAAEREASRTTTRTEAPARRAQRTLRRWWLAPALGVGAAAAAALLLVVPMAGRYLSPTAQQLAEDVPTMPSPEATAAAPAEPSPVATPSIDAVPVIAEAATEGEAPADDGTLERARSEALEAAGPSGGAGTVGVTGGDAGGASGSGGAPAREDVQSLGYAADKDAPAPPPAPVTATVPPAEPSAIAETSSAQPSSGGKSDDGWFFGETSEKKAAEPKKEKAAEGRASTRAEEADEEQMAGAVAQTATKAPASKASSKPSSSAPVGSAAPASAPATSTSTTALAASSTDLALARASAVPSDYSASAATARGDVASAFSEASSASADAALAIYGRYMADADTIVAQEATLRAAAVERRRGRNDTALGLVNRTIAAKPNNTPALSMLQLTRGDLYAARGDASTALAAYQEAARLNAAR